MSRGWPVRLNYQQIGIRPLARSDAARIEAVRARNLDWLTPWDATVPDGAGRPISSHAALIAFQRRKAREGLMMPFAVTWDRALVGQLTVNTITRGSAQSASIGYWISQTHAGRGITPIAVALVADHLLTKAGLHRVEISIRPENAASLRVVEKLGFEEIGLARRFLHIDGDWRDHRIFQVLAEDVPDGLLARAVAAAGGTS